MHILYAITKPTAGKEEIPLVAAKREDVGGQLKVVESGKPFPHTGTTTETDVKKEPGVLISVYMNATLSGAVTLTNGSTGIFTIPSGITGGTLISFVAEFDESIKVTLANENDDITIMYI